MTPNLKPDIFVFVYDDAHAANFTWMPGVEGPHAGETPQTGRMARENATIFVNYQHGNLVCTTSRIALLMGRIAGFFGMHTTIGEPSNAVTEIPESVQDWLSLLVTLGYDGRLYGKNHTGRRYHERGVFRKGWADPDGFYPPESAAEFAATLSGTEPIMRDTIVGDDVADWLHETRGNLRPRCAMIAFNNPHHEVRAPQSCKDAVNPTIKGAAREYFGGIRQTEGAIGKIMQKVRAHGRPTLCFVISDNAQLDPTFATMKDQISLGGDRRGGKGEVGGGGTSGPCLVWSQGIPEMENAPAINESYFSGLDFMATFCDMLGIEAPETEGQSMWPALKGARVVRDKPLFWYSSQPDSATTNAAHDFPAIGCLYEDLGIRAYAETDMRDFHAYRLTDITELDRMHTEMPVADVARVVGGMAQFVERCRSAGCPM